MKTKDFTLAEVESFAMRAHSKVNQKRKYSGDDYIVHPMEVVSLVRSVPHTKEMLAAAWLHDTVDDTDVTLGEIEFFFGSEVADLVEELSDVSKPYDGNRAARKAIDLAHSAKASPKGKTIKLADVISNTRNIVEMDAKFAPVYLEEKERQVQVLKEGDPILYEMAMRAIAEGKEKLAKIAGGAEK